mmetsp:Transcript_27651/g.27878  ORF Transcript_27651/g.27878 Transcript_27651/m.27878 type:complete len:192 (+) Transcript_27651:42-617(+)|eukprot:CAMPEP_0182417226 /NCGR_PEP_ID=MMETSP1167-20130531/1660_1 /TAXON_ID=2988 /ORGANISM="Mallomonas Sp, Strain CCMP3275" /LENGTH=191 /DNA_ID=CAMNT_0024590635 /DNA_START=124 /DNA_END=699 /DNA_ORIENTATION=+
MSSSAAEVMKVLVPIANGSEEIESVTIMNTLVRAGATVTSASIEDSLQITGSRGIKIVADKLIGECTSDSWDLIACPGGMPGAERLRDSPVLQQLLLKQSSESKPLAAVCASPAVVLSPLGLLDGITATGYPAPKFISAIPNYSQELVVVDGNIITSQGPATTLLFALKLVEILFGAEKADEIGKAMLVNK